MSYAIFWIEHVHNKIGYLTCKRIGLLSFTIAFKLSLFSSVMIASYIFPSIYGCLDILDYRPE